MTGASAAAARADAGGEVPSVAAEPPRAAPSCGLGDAEPMLLVRPNGAGDRGTRATGAGDAGCWPVCAAAAAWAAAPSMMCVRRRAAPSLQPEQKAAEMSLAVRGSRGWAAQTRARGQDVGGAEHDGAIPLR